MNPPIELAILAAVLLMNRILVPRVALQPVLFWSVQAVNVAGVVYMLAVGLPGTTRYPVAVWLVSALLVFHFVQNLGVRTRKRWALQREEDEREMRRMRSDLREEGPAGPA